MREEGEREEEKGNSCLWRETRGRGKAVFKGAVFRDIPIDTKRCKWARSCYSFLALPPPPARVPCRVCGCGSRCLVCCFSFSVGDGGDAREEASPPLFPRAERSEWLPAAPPSLQSPSRVFHTGTQRGEGEGEKNLWEFRCVIFVVNNKCGRYRLLGF